MTPPETKAIATESVLLHIYGVVSDREGHQTLHEAIVEAARAYGLAGVTVRAAMMGFTRGGFLYTDQLSEVTIEHKPVVVEIVDQTDRIEAFLPALHNLVRGRRLITLERSEVVHYAASANEA